MRGAGRGRPLEELHGASSCRVGNRAPRGLIVEESAGVPCQLHLPAEGLAADSCGIDAHAGHPAHHPWPGAAARRTLTPSLHASVCFPPIQFLWVEYCKQNSAHLSQDTNASLFVGLN